MRARPLWRPAKQKRCFEDKTRSGMVEVFANRPISVPIRETVNFLLSHAPPGSEILEVGCGEGEVAAELLRHGYKVTGLEVEPERVAKARQLGVHALDARWPHFETDPIDVIAFTRSLHHIDPLNLAVEKARDLLKPAGLLLIEDFSFGEVEEQSVRWFLNRLRADQILLILTPMKDQFVTRLLSAKDPFAAWQETHNQALHSIRAIKEAVSKQFVICETDSAPYLYRYLVPVLPETTEATALIQRFLEEEVRAAERGEILAMGRRIVATPGTVAGQKR